MPPKPPFKKLPAKFSLPPQIEEGNSEEYLDGFQAYLAGISQNANPHPSSVGSMDGFNMSRLHWFNGWYDSWRQHKYGSDKEELSYH